jgi:hypoxanthine phosphoribosyltransferase
MIISYDEINFYSRTIADRVKDEGKHYSRYRFARGGLIPATIISYKLRCTSVDLMVLVHMKILPRQINLISINLYILMILNL